MKKKYLEKCRGRREEFNELLAREFTRRRQTLVILFQVDDRST